MGYGCPVCETPQADARHLANHLAFTAVLRGGDHEAWLDEHCPGWDEAGEAELADRVSELADEDRVPETPEDGVGSGHDHHDHDGEAPGGVTADREHAAPGGGAPDVGDGDETRDVLERARELTRQRRAGEEDDDRADG